MQHEVMQGEMRVSIRDAVSDERMDHMPHAAAMRCALRV